jgi:hypothetical protein
VAKKAKSADDAQTGNGAGNGKAAGAKGENVAGYFRQVFKENPKLLKERSNEPLFKRWLEDHPEYNEIPQNVKTGLQNIKSVLRKDKAKRKQAARQEQPTEQLPAAVTTRPQRRTAVKELEALEEQIDECLAVARKLDPEGLKDIILYLRRARNEVVWKRAGASADV